MNAFSEKAIDIMNNSTITVTSSQLINTGINDDIYQCCSKSQSGNGSVFMVYDS